MPETPNQSIGRFFLVSIRRVTLYDALNIF